MGIAADEVLWCECSFYFPREELEQQQAAYLKTLDKFELENLGNFRRIYPAPGTEKYDKFYRSAGSLFQETAACKARSEAAK